MTQAVIFETGSKQYSAAVGDVIRIPRVEGGAGDRIAFERVLLLRQGEETMAGRPYLDGARVVGQIVEQGRDGKVVVFKLKRRTTYRCKNGHRQPHTVVRITEIQG